MYIHIVIPVYDDDDDDEIKFISHRYKVMTFLVSECKINNNNKTQQPQKRKK